MKVVLLFAGLIGLAAVNLLLNFFVPPGLKLLLVPAFALVVIAVLVKARRGRRVGAAPSLTQGRGSDVTGSEPGLPDGPRPPRG